MEKKNKNPQKKKQPQNFIPDCLEHSGHLDQIFDSLSMEYGRDNAREIVRNWK